MSNFLRDCQRLKTEKDLEAVVQIIQRHSQLGWEHVGESKLLKHPAIWAALLDRGMGLTALIRHAPTSPLSWSSFASMVSTSHCSDR